jgi:hypothetical protein
VDEESTFASSRKVSREKALAAFRLLAPDADEEFLDGKAYRTWPILVRVERQLPALV